MRRIAILSFFVFVLFAFHSDESFGGPLKPYRRGSIYDTRFGDAKKQELIEKAYRFSEAYRSRIFGQDHIGSAIGSRVRRYIEDYGTFTKEPPAIHLIGLPGVGKSASTDVLDSLGIKIFRIDAQKFERGDRPMDTARQLYWSLYSVHRYLENNPGAPAILLFDEIDKVKERLSRNDEVVQPLIATLNELLSDGVVTDPSSPSEKIELHNVLVMTAMNFHPEDIDALFLDEIKGRLADQDAKRVRSYMDFDESHMQTLDEILVSGSGRSMVGNVLLRLFRLNTITRLINDMVVTRPLYGETFDQAIEFYLNRKLGALQGSQKGARAVELSASPEFARFVRQRVVFAPSGMRTVVRGVDEIVSDLVNFGIRYIDPAVPGETKAIREARDKSLTRPRRIHLTVAENEERARVEVTGLKREGTEAKETTHFAFELKHNALSGFETPDLNQLAFKAKLPPNYKPSQDEKPLTAKAIRAKRFTGAAKVVKGLNEYLNRRIFGQEADVAWITKEMKHYMGLDPKTPPARQRFTVLAGFHGIGKSELAESAANYLNLPVKKVNLQNYIKNKERDLGADLFLIVNKAIEESKEKGAGGRFVLLLEELDKMVEVNQLTGTPDPDPNMAVVKDLLNEGKTDVVITEFGRQVVATLDIRAGYLFLTMNFAGDRFGFKADANLTTPEMMMATWKELVRVPENLRSLLAKIFLPETIDRLLNERFRVLKPITRRGFKKIVQKAIDHIIQETLYDRQGKRNLAAIDVKFTSAYRRHLMRQAMIPSEGGRHAYVAAGDLFRFDLEKAIESISRTSVYSGRPIEIQFHFKPKTKNFASRVAAGVRLVGSDDPYTKLFENDVILRVPDSRILGRVSEARMHVAGHEMGHALQSIALGERFSYTTAVSPVKGVGGYMMPTPNRESTTTGKDLLAKIMISTASIAMERILLSRNPHETDSKLEITPGPQKDIGYAMETLWALTRQLGMNPNGGVGDIGGTTASLLDHVSDERMSSDEAKRLSMVLQDLVDFQVHSFLDEQDLEWYRSKIVAFSREVGLTEKEVYQLIEQPYPGETAHDFGRDDRLREVFGADLKVEPEAITMARAHRSGKLQLTANERRLVALEFFKRSLHYRLHGIAGSGQVAPLSRRQLRRWIEESRESTQGQRCQGDLT